MIEVRVPGTVFGFGFQMSWPIVGLTHDVLIIQVVSMYGALPGYGVIHLLAGLASTTGKFLRSIE